MAADPRFTHDLDQTGAALSEIVPLLESYRETLMAHGFSRAEAMRLVVMAQWRLMGGRITTEPAEDIE